MKPAISKQAVLKASLLLVLAANMSWEPLKAFNTFDAASNESAAPTRTRAEESAAVNRPAEPRAQREQAAEGRSQIVSSSVTRKEETRNWCGVRVLIRYEAVPGENRVKGTVIRRFPDDRVLFEHTSSGSFQTIVEDADNRADFESYLEQQSRPKLGSSCAPAPTTVAANTLTAGTLTAGSMSAEQRTRLEADVRNCRKNADGSTIDSASRLECNQERLSNIASFDEDDRKAKREAQSQFNSIVEQIKKDLRKEVKTSMLSDEDVSDARTLVEDAITSIQESGEEIGISRQLVQRAVSDIRNMFSAMVKGKELKDFNERAEQDSIDMRARLDFARSELDMANTSGNPYAMSQANANMMAVLGQGMTMATIYNRTVDGRIAELRGYERMKYLEGSDFSDFTSGIEQMRRDLEIYKNGGRMSSSTLPTSLSMPEDFMQYRGNQADRYRSVYGNIPVRPTMNTQVPTNVQIPRATFTSADPRMTSVRVN